ncbi:hypothetical protein DFH07DRAFT_798577 [Mycena maculata]|uniref:Uncharacterized protein n=1 Tax=Mycena maculata TaxID=230809 RepID=A0AAD7K1X8_9AGAR|nr:hypothetical protein DFH07DRAFT_798577 [Mycena maculata]
MTESNLLTELAAHRNKRSRNSPSIYDGCVDALERLGQHSLAAHDFDVTFGRVVEDEKFISYVNLSNAKVFTAHLIAEIGSESEGTWMAAYPKKIPAYKLPLADKASAHRMIIAARCPTGAPPKLVQLYNDFMAVLDGVRTKDSDEEEQQGERFQVTEWVTRSDGAWDKPCDIMQLRLAPTYEAPKSRSKKESTPPSRPRNQKSQPVPQDTDMESIDNDSTAKEGEKDTSPAPPKERKVGDAYDPDCLPDHRGPYFAHQKSKLIQRDYKDVDGDLIAPQEVYGKLTEGTLFSAQITLHTYIWDGNPGFPRNKIYHIYVERLKILDKGYSQAWNPSIPVLPSPSAPSTPQKRGRAERDDNADSAFDTFNSVSPTKRSRK